MSRRTRLTITLREDLLRNVDDLIDSAEIRNRSHAIEVLLQQALKHAVRQAVILAGGEGVRLRPFTYEVPKALLPIGGKPLLAHTLARLKDHGLRDIIIVTGHLGEKIEEAFGTGESLGLRLHYVRQKKQSGTGGALLAAKSLLTADSPFVCLYGDVLADIDFSDFIRAHESTPQATATLALTSVADPSTFGAVRLRGMRVSEFLEKPPRKTDSSHLIFAGISVMTPDVFNAFPRKAIISLEKDVFPALIRRDALRGYPFEGSWVDVSTTATYERAMKLWANSKS